MKNKLNFKKWFIWKYCNRFSKAVPGLSDSSRTITDYGQTLRGRNALILVDGVPMNPHATHHADFQQLTPESIANIEVIRGSNAIYGGGAAGGIISITTKAAGGEPTAKQSLDSKRL